MLLQPHRLLSLASLLLLSAPLRAQRELHDRTLADILRSSGSGPDQQSGDFDVFLRLLKKTRLLPLLDGASPNGLTLLAANDLAVNNTAVDIAVTLGLPLPTSEHEALETIITFVGQYPRSPSDPLLAQVLMFHILPVQRSPDEMISQSTFLTLLGQNLSRWGGTMLGPESPDHERPFPISNFRQTELIIYDKSSIRAENGWLHQTDRLLFPHMPPWSVAKESPGIDKSSPPIASLPTTTPSVAVQNPISPAPGAISSSTPSPDKTASFSHVPIPSVSTAPASAVTPPVVPTPSDPSSVASAANQSTEVGLGSCFPGSALVHTLNGELVKLVDLEPGTTVAASEHCHSQVYLFTHRVSSGERPFVRLHTRFGLTIALTRGHYIYVNNRLVAAERVQIGDKLRTLRGPDSVVKIESTVEWGLYAPHTMHGDIVVDGIVTSTYTTAVHPALAHAALWPFRIFVRVFGVAEPLGETFYEGTRRVFGMVRGNWVVY